MISLLPLALFGIALAVVIRRNVRLERKLATPVGPKGDLGMGINDKNSWSGWVWPVPIWEGRPPVISQEWKPGVDPGPGRASGAHENHLGVDICFRKKAGDPPGHVKHLTEGPFIAPQGTPIIAAYDGKVWAKGYTSYGHYVTVDHGNVPGLAPLVTFYQHLEGFERDWQKGDEVRAGDVLGTMGYPNPEADADGFRHLHFELWFPVKGVPERQWSVDPAPYMTHWRKITLPQNVT